MSPARQRLLARLGLVALFAAGAAWLVHFARVGRISTDVLALLPKDQHAPELRLVRQLATDVQARVVLIALRQPGNSPPPAPVVAAFVRALRQNPAFAEVVELDSDAAITELGQTVFAERHHLLLPAWLAERQRRYAATTPGIPFVTWLAQNAVADLDAFLVRPEVASLQTLALRDPLLLTAPFLQKGIHLPDATAGMPVARVWARLAESPLSAGGQEPVFSAIAMATSEVRKSAPEIEVLWTGVNRLAAASRERIQKEVAFLNAASVVAVLGITLLLLRRPWRALHLVPVIALSLLGAWTSVTLVFSEVHVLVLVIGALLCGVAIDYGFYLFLEPAAGMEKVRRVIRPLLASCLTTVLGFSLLTVSDLPLLRQTGVFVVGGLVAALAGALLYALQLREPLEERRLAAGRTPLRLPRRPALIAGGAIVLLAAVFAGRLQWRDDIRELEIPAPALRADDRRVRTLFGESAQRTLYLTFGDTLAEARQNLAVFLDHLRAQVPDISVASLGELFPTAAEWSAFPAQRAGLADFPTAFRAALEEHGFESDAFAGFFSDWQAAERTPLPAYDQLYAGIDAHLQGPLRQLMHADGSPAWFLTAVDGRNDAIPRELATFPVHQLESLNELFSRYRRAALQLSLWGVLVLIGILTVLYRSRRAVRIAGVPAAACLITFGLFGAFGQTVNLFHLLGAFLGVCLAHDYAIFTAENGRPAAVRLSALTTVTSFGVLSFSQIPVIHALGLTVSGIVIVALAVIELDACSRRAP